MRLGVLGGSFNPIHEGHLAIARAARSALRLDKVVLVIAARPPHKRDDQELASPEDRLAMARLAVAGESGLEVSDQELRREGPSYTIDTLRGFLEEPGVEIWFLVGSDGLPLLSTWKDVKELLRLGTFVVVSRPGHDLREELREVGKELGAEVAAQLARNALPMKPVEISATDIRARLRSGKSIEGLVPQAVRDYIVAHGLYRTAAVKK